MKKAKVFGLVGLLTSVTLVAVGNAEQTALSSWRNAVSTNDFKVMLATVRTIQDDWPAVHSVKHAVNKDGEKALLQKDYRNVAKTFWQGLENYEKIFRDMPPESFCEGAEVLLEIRKRFMQNSSYVNYFLADSINRVIYINLGERLAKAGDLPVCYDRIVERLAEFRYDWSQLFVLTKEEYDGKSMTMADIKDLSYEYKIETIEKMIGQENFFFAPQDIHNLYRLRILEKRSLSALLNRLTSSDHFIRASLPALLSYRRKTAQFTPTDSFSQIRAVLGNETLLPPTLLYGQSPLAATVVNDFLRGVCSEHWRHTLYFSDLPIFTKEFIERQEEKEAEREAQREAK
jgi:hypothetical protein